MLLGSSIVLFYYATLRLHFFNQNPVIHNKFIGHAVLVIVVFYLFFYTIKKQKQGFMVIALLLSYFTALSSSIPHFTLSLLVISSGMAGYIYLQKNWDMILLLGLVLTYLSHLIWFFNNPILGQPIQAVAQHHYNLIYLVLYSTLFGTIIAFSKKSREGEFFNILSSLMNSAGIIFIGALNILTFFKGSVSLLACCTFLYFFFLASFNWIKTLNYYTTSIYSCFAHITLSVSILSYFQYPDYFIWLSIQSYLAILTALWFRSKIIVIANIFIYMGIYLFYLIFSASHNWINFSYALTALLSARTLNWKKQRLNIKTELIRNTYLLCSFVVVLYGLEKGVTGPFVSISWLGASLFYFITSILLKNIKYRWMAILTIFATVIRVFLIDTSKLDPGYRIILFVITGGIILVLSLIYKKYEKSIKSDKT